MTHATAQPARFVFAMDLDGVRRATQSIGTSNRKDRLNVGVVIMESERSERPEAPEAAIASAPARAAETSCGAKGAAAAGAEHQDAAGHPPAHAQTLSFELLRSALYHDARQSHLEWVDRLAHYATALAGSAAFATVLGNDPAWAAVAAAFATAISMAGLVFDFAGRARTHQLLRREFYGLLADSDAPSCRARMTRLYADEPPIKWAVNALAHNQAARALCGDDAQLLGIDWTARRLAHWRRFDPSRFPDLPKPRKADRS